MIFNFNYLDFIQKVIFLLTLKVEALLYKVEAICFPISKNILIPIFTLILIIVY